VAKRLRHHALVVGDLQQAIEWYERRSSLAANRFRAAVRTALDQIAAAPELNAVVFEESSARLIRLARFPYIILYRLCGDIVVVEGVFHASMNSDAWRRRVTQSSE
jgi:plasmid stabilization system protein ParE